MNEYVPLEEYERENRRQGKQPQPVKAIPFLSYSQMQAMPEPEWLIDGVLPKRSAVTLFGASNSFKSFVAIDMALSVQTGLPWHGTTVARGNVAYVATEGAAGIGRLRIPAWYDFHDIAESDRGGFLVPQEVKIDQKGEIDALIAALNRHGPFALLVLDLYASTISGPESEVQHAQAAVTATQRIIRECACTVLAVQHTGWGDQQRARGHSHTWGSWDTRLKAEGDKDARTVTMSVDRHKDADSVGKWGFRLEDAGQSLVPVRDDAVRAKARKATVTGQTKQALDALDEALIDHGEQKQGENWPSCKIAYVDRWREMCRRRGLSSTDEPAAARQAFNRARNALKGLELIAELDGYVWKTSGD